MIAPKIVDRIRKLLALSKSSNENEADVAMSKANDMMALHQLSMSDVEVGELTKNSIKEEYFKVDGQKMKLLWIEDLAFGCARMFDATVLTNRGLHGTSFTFVGFAEDIELAKAMFQHLYLSWFPIVEADLIDAKNYHQGVWAPRDTMRFKAGHGKAYAHRIHYRIMYLIQDRKREVQSTTTGTALVLAKDTAMDEYRIKQNWTTRKAKSSNGSVQGIRAGRRAADAARLSTEIE